MKEIVAKMVYESLSRNRGPCWRVLGASQSSDTQQKCLPKLVTYKHGNEASSGVALAFRASRPLPQWAPLADSGRWPRVDTEHAISRPFSQSLGFVQNLEHALERWSHTTTSQWQ